MSIFSKPATLIPQSLNSQIPKFCYLASSIQYLLSSTSIQKNQTQIPSFKFPYITNHSCKQEKAIKIQKDKSLDKRAISGTFTINVRDATAQKNQPTKKPSGFFSFLIRTKVFNEKNLNHCCLRFRWRGRDTS